MHKLLVRRPDAIIPLLAAYCILAFLVRIALPNSLRIDESQQAFFTQWLTLGYDSQPPLYNWVQTLFTSVFGLSMTTVEIVKQLFLFLIYVSYYRLAREVLSDRVLAAIATLSLLTIQQFSWQGQRDLTHTVAQLLMINLLLLAIIRTLKSPSLGGYLAIGISLGLGMLTKYNFALLAIGALVAVWLYPGGRQRIFDKRFLLAIAVSLLIFLPHGLWLIHNLGLATGRTLGVMEEDAPANVFVKLIQGPAIFVELVFVIVAPTVAIYFIVFGKSFSRSLRQTNDWVRFFDAIFLVVGLLILGLIIGIGMTALRDRWLLPFLFLLPIYLCLKMEIAGVKGAEFGKRFFYVPLALMLIIPALVPIRVIFPKLFKNYEAYSVPYRSFVQETLKAEGKEPGLVITDNWMPAGNLRMQLPHIPVMSRFFPNLTAPYQWTADRPILVVWLPKDDADRLPTSLQEWVNDNLGPQYATPTIKNVQVPYINGSAGDTERFTYAWIYRK